MRRDQQCSICSSRPEVLAAVNAELSKPPAQRKRLRDLARESGFSKSTLSHHAIAHLDTNILNAHRDRKASTARMLVRWPDQSLTVTGAVGAKAATNGTIVPPENVQPDDVIVTIKFARAEVRNPTALLAEAHAEDLERNPPQIPDTVN